MASPTRIMIERDETLIRSGNADLYYEELTHRNRHFINPETQAKLRALKVVVAGCGAGGGACIEPLARVGVTHFRLADNGFYELSNMNRQHTFVDRLGENKADFHASELKRINPYIDVKTYPEGVTLENLESIVQWADIVLDCVDVTNPISIQMKFRLHEVSHRNKKPVLSPLDPGFVQMGKGYDYRNPSSRPLNGKLEECLKIKNPIKALLAMFPIEEWPTHCLELVRDLLQKPQQPASQIGASADVLSGVIVAALVRFAETQTLVSSWHINLDHLAFSSHRRIRLWWNAFFLRRQLKKLIKTLQ